MHDSSLQKVRANQTSNLKEADTVLSSENCFQFVVADDDLFVCGILKEEKHKSQFYSILECRRIHYQYSAVN